MNTGKYIRRLLEEGNRVILPGFGNLEIRETGKTAPPSGGRIDPPGPVVRFDGSFSKDDGLLAETVAAGEGIDPEEARQRVLELVDAIRFALDKGEPCELQNAGTFTKDQDGKIHFRPDPEWVMEPDQYGLDSMDLLELEELPEEEEAEDATGDKPSAAPAGEKPETQPEKSTEKPAGAPVGTAAPANGPTPPGTSTSPGASEPTGKQVTDLAPPVEPIRRSNRWRVIWIVAGVLIVVLLVLILVPVDFISERVPGENVPEEKVESGANDEAENVDAEAVERVEQGQVQEQEGVREAGPVGEEAVAPVAESHDYFIIAGSFRNLKNASDLQDELRAGGYESEVMITENRMYRVSVASFASKQEAQRALERIKSEPGMGSCWLLAN